MPRPLIFCDLAGTLEIADPVTALPGPWPEARGVLAALTRDHDLHLATGESRPGALATLRSLELQGLFRELHTDLPGGGKPYAALAARAGQSLDLCVAIGDDPIGDTARDTDAVVSVLVRHRPRVVRPTRVAAMVRALGGAGSFRAGFAVAVAAAAHSEQAGASPGQATHWDDLPHSDLAGGGRLGWWDKPGYGPRPVVALGW